jgi:hypothetical protein
MSFWMMAAILAAAAVGTPHADESIEVVVRGTLRTGIMAIGGETTGTTITARGATWELDLRGDAALAAKARDLSGRRVVVRGSLEVKRGVERRQRWIVTVRSLEAASPASPPAVPEEP